MNIKFENQTTEIVRSVAIVTAETQPEIRYYLEYQVDTLADPRQLAMSALHAGFSNGYRSGRNECEKLIKHIRSLQDENASLRKSLGIGIAK